MKGYLYVGKVTDPEFVKTLNIGKNSRGRKPLEFPPGTFPTWDEYKDLGIIDHEKNSHINIFAAAEYGALWHIDDIDSVYHLFTELVLQEINDHSRQLQATRSAIQGWWNSWTKQKFPEMITADHCSVCIRKAANAYGFEAFLVKHVPNKTRVAYENAFRQGVVG